MFFALHIYYTPHRQQSKMLIFYRRTFIKGIAGFLCGQRLFKRRLPVIKQPIGKIFTFYSPDKNMHRQKRELLGCILKCRALSAEISVI